MYQVKVKWVLRNGDQYSTTVNAKKWLISELYVCDGCFARRRREISTPAFNLVGTYREIKNFGTFT